MRRQAGYDIFQTPTLNAPWEAHLKSNQRTTELELNVGYQVLELAKMGKIYLEIARTCFTC
jgi:hypothetical protein